ncbi:MAG: ABC transporter ATP-binding protein [Desulfamplus sp.]|nr:ABC transporter ATP-binding protein [Desulfamplus sp.]
MIYSVEIRNVSKVYRLYRKPSDRLKEVLIKRPCHRAFHSLSQVSLDIPHGESLGIVGDNGAGKSTLLKIVAGTLQPTSGDVRRRGRVAALLELGAGFHYEFTGRQNIWMNASLLGLSRDEIRAREGDIIAFSELGEFIDRPIKTYSSGMVMRLAFSIATTVDPDILIIDEALSVGDHYFQKKCIDRMLEFKNSSRTILFCSHAMFLVNQLCDRAVWIDGGAVRQMGLATHVTAAYENFSRQKSQYSLPEGVSEDAPPGTSLPEDVSGDAPPGTSLPEDVSGDAPPGTPSASGGSRAGHGKPDTSPVQILSIVFNGCHGDVEMEQGEDLRVEIKYESLSDMEFFVAAGIRRNDDLACHVTSMARVFGKPLKGPGVGQVTLHYRGLPFLHGNFSVVAFAMDSSHLHCFHKKESPRFSIKPLDTWENEMGLLRLDHEWILD